MENRDIIEIARELGRQLQKEEAYIKFNMARQAADEDKELQKLITRFSAEPCYKLLQLLILIRSLSCHIEFYISFFLLQLSAKLSCNFNNISVFHNDLPFPIRYTIA